MATTHPTLHTSANTFIGVSASSNTAAEQSCLTVVAWCLFVVRGCTTNQLYMQQQSNTICSTDTYYLQDILSMQHHLYYLSCCFMMLRYDFTCCYWCLFLTLSSSSLEQSSRYTLYSCCFMTLRVVLWFNTTEFCIQHVLSSFLYSPPLTTLTSFWFHTLDSVVDL